MLFDIAPMLFVFAPMLFDIAPMSFSIAPMQGVFALMSPAIATVITGRALGNFDLGAQVLRSAPSFRAESGRGGSF